MAAGGDARRQRRGVGPFVAADEGQLRPRVALGDEVEGTGQLHLCLARLDRADADSEVGFGGDSEPAPGPLAVEAAPHRFDRRQVEAVGDGERALGDGRVEPARRLGLEDRQVRRGQRRFGVLAQARPEAVPEQRRRHALVDRPDHRQPEGAADVGARQRQRRRRVDEDEVEFAPSRPGEDLLAAVEVGVEVVKRQRPQQVHGHPLGFEVRPQRAVDRADDGGLDPALPPRLGEEVVEVQRGAAEGEHVAEGEHPQPVAARRGGEGARRPRLRLGLGGEGDRNRPQQPLLAAERGRHRPQLDLQVLRRRLDPRPQLEAAEGGLRGGVEGGDVGPGQPQPRPPQRLVPQPGLDLRHRVVLEQGPTADDDHARLEAEAGGRMVEAVPGQGVLAPVTAQQRSSGPGGGSTPSAGWDGAESPSSAPS